jgi:hypothetical protein
MPRITFDSTTGYTPKPVGVLKAEILSVDCREPSDPMLPNSKYIKDPSNNYVIIFKVRPEEHDREHDIYIPIKIVYDKDGMVDIKNSRGLKDINNTILNELGFKKAGYNPKGAFEDEQGNIIQEDQIPFWLNTEIMNRQGFRVVVYVYKAKGTGDYASKYFFRCSRFIYPNTEAGIAYAEKEYQDQLLYLENKAKEMEQHKQTEQTKPIKRTI